MKVIDKSKITITILSIVFVLSLSVTITLAAFSANKTGDVTLTFSDGLTMTVNSKGNNNRIRITDAGVDDYTFNYAPQNNSTRELYYDTVQAKLNKAGWVSYTKEVFELINNAEVIPTGEWAPYDNSAYWFNPSGERSDWRIGAAPNKTYFNITCSGNKLVCIGKTQWAADTLVSLWNDWAFSARDLARASYIDDLAGRSFVIKFTVKAQTDQAPTFS